MLKSFFILLFSLNLLVANTNITKGDIEFVKKNYIKAITYYKIEYKNHTPKARIKLIMSYLKLGDNFSRIKNYQESLKWYNYAKDLKSRVATKKISKIYEKQADQFYKIKHFKDALELYKKSLKLGNKHSKNKIKKIKKILDHKKTLKNDTRKVVTKSSPPWTKAIGRVIIPTKLKRLSKNSYRTNFKKCSATLVSSSLYNSSKVIITASHCLKEYDPTIGNIRFIIKSKKDKMLSFNATIYKDSHFRKKAIKYKSDYAILILDKKISTKDVTPVVVKKRSFYELQKEYKNHFASLGGFSSDVGDYGGLITYDPKCKLKKYNRYYGASSCRGFKGASGGPIILTTIKNNKENYYFVGVVSYFKRGAFQKIFFAPHHIFYDDIIKALKVK